MFKNRIQSSKFPKNVPYPRLRSCKRRRRLSSWAEVWAIKWSWASSAGEPRLAAGEGRRVAVAWRPWTETSKTSAVLCLHWTLLCGLKLSQSSTAYVALVLLNCKVDSRVCGIDFHLMFIKCFKVASVDYWTSLYVFAAVCLLLIDGVWAECGIVWRC